jgi:hypothetical protein
MTNKQLINFCAPKARLDYYESLRRAGKPCWFIRDGLQGKPYTDICASPRDAWKAAADSLRASCLSGKAAA